MVFVTIATRLLKKWMSSNMQIPVLMATAILHILGRKYASPFSCPWVGQWGGEVNSRIPSRVDETLRFLVSGVRGWTPLRLPLWKQLSSTKSHNQCLSPVIWKEVSLLLLPSLMLLKSLETFLDSTRNTHDNRYTNTHTTLTHTHPVHWESDRCGHHRSSILLYISSLIHSCLLLVNIH